MKTTHPTALLLLMLTLFCLTGYAQKEVTLTPQIVYETHVRQSKPEREGWWFENIEASKRTAMINMLMDKAQSGELPITQTTTLGDLCPLSKCKISPADLHWVMNSVDTSYTEDIETGELVMVVQETAIKNRDIVRLEFLEEWVYDTKKEQFVKKVNAVGMMVAVYDEISGELRGYKPLFYIWFNEVEMME